MTGSNSNVFTVTVQKNGIALNTLKKTVVYQENGKKWDVFRSALSSIRADVNNFLTEEVASKKINIAILRLCIYIEINYFLEERQQNKESSKRECSDEESDDASKSTKRQRQK